MELTSGNGIHCGHLFLPGTPIVVVPRATLVVFADRHADNNAATCV